MAKKVRDLRIYRKVTSEKPHVKIYIDDNGYRFENWEDTIKDIKEVNLNDYRLNVFKKASICRHFENKVFQLSKEKNHKISPVYLFSRARVYIFPSFNDIQ